MDVEKICRTCLSLSGPFLSIYDDGSGSGLVDMIREFTRTKPRREDNMPAKVCLNCISEINHCYSFKLKCESSNRTLRQLLPNALPEEPDVVPGAAAAAAVKPAVITKETSVQTNAVSTSTSEAQTDVVSTSEAGQNTSILDTTEVMVPGVLEADDEFDYEFSEDPETEETPTKTCEENIILHVEKDYIKCETEMVYNKSTGELQAQDSPKSKQREYKYRLVSNGVGDTYIAPETTAPTPTTAQPQVTTRKSAAKLLQQQQQQQHKEDQQSSQPQVVEAEEHAVTTAKRSSRRRLAVPLVDSQQPKRSVPTKSQGSTEAEDLKANFHCDRCNAGFVLEKSLIIHRRQKGCTNRSFKCNECERVFVSVEHLNEHQATHASHNCQECGMRCESKEQLGRHMVQTHKRNLRNQCNICQKVFTMLSTLRDHMRIHTGEKPFVCNVCGKGFTQNANLRQHKLRHSDIKRFKCELCGNSFVTKAELTSHARTHTGVKPYECDVCSSRFTTSCSLAKHKRKHTGERPYACDLCPMRFTALNVLKNHRRTHTGERPFVCPFCSKSFTQRGDCQMHQRTHQGDKIYICPVCSEEFKNMNEMRAHLTIHEQEDKRLVPFTLLSNKENGNATLEEADDESNTSELM